MSSVCPNCSKELSDDFGIVTCASCGTVCFIDLDGSVQVQDKELEALQEQEESLQPEEEFQSEEESSYEETYEAEAEAADPEDFLKDEALSEAPLEADSSLDFGNSPETFEDSFEDSLEDSEEASSEEESEPEEEPEVEKESDFAAAVDGAEEQVANESESLEYQEEDSASPEQDEIAETESGELNAPRAATASAVPPSAMSADLFFKDMEVFLEKDRGEAYGHVFYDLHIEGQFSGTEVDLLVEFLEDSRIGLPEDKIRNAVDQEGLYLPNIKMLHLTMILKRLLHSPFQAKWFLSENQEALEEVLTEEGEELSEDSDLELENESSFQEEDYFEELTEE